MALKRLTETQPLDWMRQFQCVGGRVFVDIVLVNDGS